MTFITNLINGVSLGSIYAVIALGYTMVYGIAKMLNFAHGDVIMVGAYIVFALTSYAGVNPYLALVISMAACTLLGMAIERFAYKPLRGASPLAVLITAIGVSYFLQNMALLIFGSQAKSFTSIVNLPALTLAGGKITISAETIVTIIVSLIIMVSLTLFVNKTKPGRAMLAVSEDKGAAQLMGVNVNATISLTFAIGSGLAAVAGVLLCSAYPTLSSQTGAMPGIKAFVAAVLGGIGSIPGAVIGGVLIGVIEILSRSYISSQMADAIVFAVLIIVLLVKPTGILGKKYIEWFIAESGFSEAEGGINTLEGSKLPDYLSAFDGCEFFTANAAPDGLTGVFNAIDKDSEVGIWTGDSANFKLQLAEAAFAGKGDAGFKAIADSVNQKWAATRDANAELEAYIKANG